MSPFANPDEKPIGHECFGGDGSPDLAGAPPLACPLPRLGGVGKDASSAIGIRTRKASAVRRRGVEWLWPGRLAFGHVHVLDGDPGLGKSTIALDVAARLSRGLPMPAPPAPPAEAKPVSRSRKPEEPEPTMPVVPHRPALGASIVISAEDSDESAIRPRLEAAGADLEQIHIVEEFAARDANGNVVLRPLLLPDDVPELEKLIAAAGARLVVIDPVMGFIGHDRRGRQIDANKDQSVRRLMYPLRRLAERTGVCVLLIRHLSKSLVASALRRGLASIGIAASARVVLLAAAHPKASGVRALAGVKCNVGPVGPTLAYRMSQSAEGAPCVEWLDECDYAADDLLGVAGGKARRSRLEAAEDFLKGMLRDGPQPALVVLARAHSLGISERTLNRAAGALDIIRTKQKGQWVWQPPRHSHYWGNSLESL